jgi:hypothetical protein
MSDPGIKPETRHHHYGEWHDHPDGEKPHNHGTPQRRGLSAVSAGSALGVILFTGALAAIVWSYTDSDATACKNALVGALASSQCTTATFWHDIAGVTFWGAVILAVLIAVAMTRRRAN